ncbi:MAG: ACT domain-containing protein [Acidimicrobiales bacterium]
MCESSTVLASVHGPDRPGITAGLMEVLCESDLVRAYVG